ncbi:hypothetical protein Tco_1045381 [Tanacetum coccineum]|uniref:Uncharacterized protein n=1 Tax=Tanacetum coccineum TaxID=301880 RepID=A0ABQ5GTV2_9ASTR
MHVNVHDNDGPVLLYEVFPSYQFRNLISTPPHLLLDRNCKSLVGQGSAQGDQEAVKECYKEYIGMVKIYYEGAQRSKQGRPGEDVVGNSSGTAWIKEPQAFAKMSFEIEDTLDGTPRKKSRIARDDVNKESNEKQKQLEGLFRCRLPTISDAWRLEA